MLNRLRERVRARPDQLALVFNDEKISYWGLLENISAARGFLQSRGLRAGDLLALGFGSCPAFVYAFYAALSLGLQIWPLNTKSKEAELLPLMQKLKPKLILYSPKQDFLSSSAACSLADFKSQMQDLKGSYELLPVKGAQVLIHSSGSTGRPKAVVIEEGNLLAALDAYAVFELKKTVLASPIFHITGLVGILAFALDRGACVFLQERFAADEVLALIEREHVDFLHASYSLYALLLQEAKQQKLSSIPCVKTLLCGAGPLPEHAARGLLQLFSSASMHPVYGLSESSSPFCIYQENDYLEGGKIGSSGLPVLSSQISIRDADFKELPAGEIGRIFIKGPTVIKGYLNGAFSELFKDGFLDSKDLGYVDADGFLFVKDREKDMINRGGEKIYCHEVEEMISSFLGVREVALAKRFSELYLEEPVAFLVVQKDFKEELLKDFLKSNLSAFKRPVDFIYLDALPKTATGKVDKQKLSKLLNKENG